MMIIEEGVEAGHMIQELISTLTLLICSGNSRVNFYFNPVDLFW